MAAVGAFVAALLFVLRMSSRRRRRDAMTASARPPGYGPPPLWTGPPYDQPRR